MPLQGLRLLRVGLEAVLCCTALASDASAKDVTSSKQTPPPAIRTKDAIDSLTLNFVADSPTEPMAAPPKDAPLNITQDVFNNLILGAGEIQGKVFPVVWLKNAMLYIPQHRQPTLKIRGCRLKPEKGIGVPSYFVVPSEWSWIDIRDSVFEEDTEFVLCTSAKFYLINCTFEGRLEIAAKEKTIDVDLDHITFRKSFSIAGTDKQVMANVTSSTVEGSADVRSLGESSQVQFFDCHFQKEFVFVDAPFDHGDSTKPMSVDGTKIVGFYSVTFDEQALIENSTFRSLVISAWGTKPSTVAKGRLRFEHIGAGNVDLRHAQFKRDVQFVHCRFGNMQLDDASFADEISFRSTDITQGFSVDDARFDKSLRLEWRRMEKKGPWFRPFATAETVIGSWGDDFKDYIRSTPAPPQPASAGAWQNLRDAWRASGNNEGSNEADYRRQQIEVGMGPSLLVWGYGYRPVRVLLWLVCIIIAFGIIYTSQVQRRSSEPQLVLIDDELRVDRVFRQRKLWERFRDGIRFSLRAGWEWKYGWNNTQGGLWTAIALTEQVCVKVLLLLFAKALANTSPLLNEITSKLLPFG